MASLAILPLQRIDRQTCGGADFPLPGAPPLVVRFEHGGR